MGTSTCHTWQGWSLKGLGAFLVCRSRLGVTGSGLPSELHLVTISASLIKMQKNLQNTLISVEEPRKGEEKVRVSC